MKLYELSSEFNQVLRLLEDICNGDSDIPEEAAWDTIEGIEMELRDKAINVACVIKSLNADVNAFKEEEKKLAERRKALERQVDHLKSYLEFELNSAGVTEIKDRPQAQITFRKSKSIKIEDDDAFIEWALDAHREDLLNIRYAPSKTAIKESLDVGAEIPGATVTESKSIIIK